MDSWLIALASFIPMLLLLAVVHELGHFWMAAVMVELGGRTVFWALAQWQKDREAARRERRRRSARDRAAGIAAGRAAGIAAGIAEGQRGIVVDMWASAQSDEERAYVRRVAEARGIALPPQGE